MDKLNTLGRIIFTLPFGIFGLMHLLNAGDMAGMVPAYLPGSVFWVYLTGLVLIAATVLIIIQKYMFHAGLVLAGLMFIFILTIHIPGLLSGNMMAMSGVLKDAGLAGAALMLASRSRA